MPQKRYAEDLFKEIEEWRGKISGLQERGERLDSKTRAEFLDLLSRINHKNEDIQKIKAEFEKGGTIDKTRLRSKIEALLADLNKDYRDALAHYH